MKNFSAFLVAMVLCLCSIFSSASAFTATAESTQSSAPTVLEYLEQFETSYYTGNFDLDNNGQLDVFDLALLKMKCENSEDGVTIRTVEKFQNWLLADPDATLNIKKAKNSKIFGDVTEESTQYLKNLLSNDFRLISSNYREVNGKFVLELWFLENTETKIKGATFLSYSEDPIVPTTVIAETDGFYVIDEDGRYAISFKEKLLYTVFGMEKSWFELFTPESETEPETEPETEVELEKPSYLGPAIAKIDLTAYDFSISENFEDYVNIANSEKKLYIDEICQIATVDFSSPDAEFIVIVPITNAKPIRGTVLYYCDEFIIFYSADEAGFRLAVNR
jgi:hypothetical protein